MKSLRFVILLAIGLGAIQPLSGQKLRLKKPKKKKKTETQVLDSLTTAQAPTIDLEEEPEEAEPKKKKRKKFTSAELSAAEAEGIIHLTSTPTGPSQFTQLSSL